MSELPPLRPWQAEYLAAHRAVPKQALFASPRLGKTRVGGELAKLWGRALVLCPLSVAKDWTALLGALGLRVVNAAALSSAKAADLFARTDLDAIVLNDDKLVRVQAAAQTWLGAGGGLIVDESHRMASYRSSRGKAMRKIARAARYVRLMTGTPVGSHAGNLWGQMTAIRPEAWGWSYTAFAGQHLITDPIFRSTVYGVRDPERLRAMLRRDAVIVRREDVFGPDSWQEVVRKVELPQQALNVYDRMAHEWVIDAPTPITAQSMPIVLLRLAQIASGFVPGPDGDTLVHDAKIVACLEDLDEIAESGERAVVFYRFTAEGDELERRARKRFGDENVYRLFGESSIDERAATVDAIATGKGFRIAIVQMRAGGLGISFARAKHAMFLSEDFSFIDWQQARDRVFSPGQARVVTHYRAAGTVDEYIAQVLDGKASLHEDVRNGDRRAITFGSRYRAKSIHKEITRTKRGDQ